MVVRPLSLFGELVRPLYEPLTLLPLLVTSYPGAGGAAPDLVLEISAAILTLTTEVAAEGVVAPLLEAGAPFE